MKRTGDQFEMHMYSESITTPAAVALTTPAHTCCTCCNIYPEVCRSFVVCTGQDRCDRDETLSESCDRSQFPAVHIGRRERRRWDHPSRSTSSKWVQRVCMYIYIYIYIWRTSNLQSATNACVLRATSTNYIVIALVNDLFQSWRLFDKRSVKCRCRLPSDSLTVAIK